jgi:hypothetical protein
MSLNCCTYAVGDDGGVKAAAVVAVAVILDDIATMKIDG